jgi:hypothetical protein
MTGGERQFRCILARLVRIKVLRFDEMCVWHLRPFILTHTHTHTHTLINTLCLNIIVKIVVYYYIEDFIIIKTVSSPLASSQASGMPSFSVRRPCFTNKEQKDDRNCQKKKIDSLVLIFK